MAEDIVPGLQEAIEKDFQNSFQTDSTLISIYEKIQNGTATQKDGEAFARELGTVLTDVFHRNVTPEQLPAGRMYYNIANRLIPPALEQNHGLVNEVMRQIITKQNADAGIGLRYQDADFDKDKVHGLVERAANYPQYEVVQNDVETGLTTFTQGVADEAVHKNAAFQASAGLHPRIVRETDGDCCKWCLDLAGTYDYESAPPEVYARHANCGCSVEFRPGDGKRQDVWSKALISDAEFAKIESRRGVEGLADDRSFEQIEARQMSKRREADDTRPLGDYSETVPRDVSKSERESIIQYAEERGVFLQGIKEFDGDIELLKSVIDTTAKWQELLPCEKRISIGVHRLNAEDFGETIGRGITINSLILRDRLTTEKGINADPGRFASSKLEDVVAHEYAHAYTNAKRIGLENILSIAEEAYKEVGSPGGDWYKFMVNCISAYAVEVDEKMPLGTEVASEILAKHNSDATDFTSTYLKLLRERG